VGLEISIVLTVAEPPGFNEAIVLRKNNTVEAICGLIHKDLATQFKYALVWVRKNEQTNLTLHRERQ
jgi:ribosome-interacting GTPase 1